MVWCRVGLISSVGGHRGVFLAKVSALLGLCGFFKRHFWRKKKRKKSLSCIVNGISGFLFFVCGRGRPMAGRGRPCPAWPSDAQAVCSGRLCPVRHRCAPACPPSPTPGVRWCWRCERPGRTSLALSVWKRLRRAAVRPLDVQRNRLSLSPPRPAPARTPRLPAVRDPDTWVSQACLWVG